MDNIPYTVSELAGCLAVGPARNRYDLYLRRLRHWAAAGILKGNVLYPGTGQSRQFGAEEAYRASVLIRLIGDWGLSIGVLKAIADTMDLLRKRDAEAKLWEYAKTQESRKDDHIFMDLSITLDAEGVKPTSVSIGLVRGTGRLHPAYYPDESSRLSINLTDTFAAVQLL
jgi:hypothetical protein